MKSCNEILPSKIILSFSNLREEILESIDKEMELWHHFNRLDQHIV